jgi:hypothetical protein
VGGGMDTEVTIYLYLLCCFLIFNVLQLLSMIATRCPDLECGYRDDDQGDGDFLAAAAVPDSGGDFATGSSPSLCRSCYR